jgi:uncharacterized membrane protein YqjE
MPAPLDILPKFAPIIARHFAAYLELLADETTELGSHMARRVASLIITMMAVAFALALGCVWILNAVWDTPWRQAGIIGLFLLFAAIALVTWLTARRVTPEWSPFQRLRSEWTLDQQLIVELMDENHREATAAPMRDVTS